MSYEKYLRWGAITGLFLVPVIPFLITSNMFFPFITGKNIAFRVLIEIVVALWLLLALKEPAYRPRFSYLGVAMLAFVVWMGIATFFSIDPVKSFWSNFERMEGYIGLLHLFGYFVVAACILGAQRLWERFFAVSIVASAVAGTYGMFQLSGLITINQGGVRLDGPLGNATYFGIYLLFHVFLALYLLAHRARSENGFGDRTKIATVFAGGIVGLALLVWAAVAMHSPAPVVITYLLVGGGGLAFISMRERSYFTGFILFALAVDAAALFFTESRGPLLGTFGGLALAAGYVWWAGRREGMSWPRLQKAAQWIAIGLAASAVLFVLLRTTPIVQQVPALNRIASISFSDTTTQARILVWNMAWQGFLERPITGWGQENFSFVFNKFYDPRMHESEQWFDRTHNSFLDWLIAGGLPAFLLFISFFGLAVLILVRMRELSVPERGVLLGLLAAYGFHSIFVFDNLVSSIYFFTILAFLYGHSQHPLPMSVRLSRPVSEKGVAVAAPVVIVLTVLALYLVNVPAYANATGLLTALRPHEGGTAAQNVEAAVNDFRAVFERHPLGRQEAAEQLMQLSSNFAGSQNPDPAAAQILFGAVKDLTEKMLVLRPNDVRLEMFYGVVLDQFGILNEGRAVLQKALDGSPKKQGIMFELAVNNYLRAGDTDQALNLLKTAFELAPDFVDARIYYVLALYKTNQISKADALIEERWGTLTPAGDSSDKLLQVYVSLGLSDRIIAMLKGRIAAAPQNQNLYLTLASYYYSQGDKRAAIEVLREAAEAIPSYADEARKLIEQVTSEL